MRQHFNISLHISSINTTTPRLIYFFPHAEQFQWHSDDPDYDGVPLLHNFKFSYPQEEGYVNICCVWPPGSDPIV